MKTSEVLQVHIALNSDEDQVRIGSTVCNIKRWNSPTHMYSVCGLGKYEFRSQNMAKDSRWTHWIATDPQNRSITWIFYRSGGYAGKVEQDGLNVKVLRFHPDRTIYDGDISAALSDLPPG